VAEPLGSAFGSRKTNYIVIADFPRGAKAGTRTTTGGDLRQARRGYRDCLAFVLWSAVKRIITLCAQPLPNHERQRRVRSAYEIATQSLFVCQPFAHVESA